MNGKSYLYIDQYNTIIGWFDSVKELKAHLGHSKARKMYVDKRDGSTKHVGYVIGKHWLKAFQEADLS